MGQNRYLFGLHDRSRFEIVQWFDYGVDTAGVVTLVDASNVLQDLVETDVCGRQIALADLLILNKADRVSPEAIEARI